jgi:hypothetical protein
VVENLNLQLKFEAAGVPKTIGEINKISAQVKQIQAENRKSAATARALADAYGLTEAEVRQVTEALKKVDAAKISEDLRAANVQAELLKSGFSSMKDLIAGAFGEGLRQFAQFEQFEGVLETALGSSEAAEAALATVEGFAAKTPFQLAQVVDGFTKLQNRGINPTNERLRQLGDLTSSQSKGLDQIVEAVLDAQTGEFERLKEFGIRASTAGDQVTLAFKGVEQTVAKTPEAISEAIFAFGDLEGIAGSMERQSQTLSGQLSNLQDEATKAGRAFGEFAVVGVRPVVETGISLLQTFNDLPAPIQKSLIASTAFTGVLVAAVAAITAYNLANGQRVVQEAIASINTVKSTIATVADTGATAAATAAKALYARVLGQATAAQIAQTNALGAGALKMGLFAGAAASVALVIDTFRSVNAEANKTREATEGVSVALNALGAGKGAADAAASVREIEQGLNPVQRVLDNLIRGPLPGLATAAESSARGAEIAFGDLISKTGDVRLAALEVAKDLEDGVTIDPAVVENTVAAIDANIEALREATVVTEQDAAARDANIERLQEYRDRIASTTEGVVALSDATGSLTDKIKELSGELDAAKDGIENLESEAQAAVEEAYAAGEISAEERQRSLTAIEQNGLRDRIDANRQSLGELNELLAATDDPEKQAEINAEITKLDTQLNKDRISLARSAADAREAAEEAISEAAEETAKRQEDAAKAAADARIQAAQKEGDRLQEIRDKQNEAANEQFSDEQGSTQEAFQDGQNAKQEAFQDGQNAKQEAFQDGQNAKQEAFQDGQNAKQEAFQRSQEARRENFEKGLQAAAAKFQDEQQRKRDQANREFSALTDEVDRRLQLEEAGSREERKRLEEQFAAEDARLRRRRQIESEVLAQRSSVLANAEGLDLGPLEQARQQFEEQLQAESEAFQAGQQEARKAFEAELKEEEKAFQLQQREEEKAFQLQQREEEKAFQLQQREEEKAFQLQQREEEKAFQLQQREEEKAFKELQRRLDLQTANNIKAILESARAGTQARRKGGPVAAGQPYLVGEAGPELIYPSRSGYVATARETAAIMKAARVRSQLGFNQVLNASSRGVEQRLDAILEAVQSRPRPTAPAQINLNQGTVYDAVSAALAHQRAVIRGMGL